MNKLKLSLDDQDAFRQALDWLRKQCPTLKPLLRLATAETLVKYRRENARKQEN